MTRSSFRLLITRLNHHLVRDEFQVTRSSGGVVQSNVRLAITLRLLAGGSNHDQMMCWGVGLSCTFKISIETLIAVKLVLKMPGIPFDDQNALEQLAHGFKYSRNRPNSLYGWIGALEGIPIAINKPPDEYVTRNLFVGKECMHFHLQAVADSHMMFRYMSCHCTGSTHDAAAFDVSELAVRLKDVEMNDGFWIAGDAAYVRIPGLLTPWSKGALSGEGGIYASTFITRATEYTLNKRLEFLLDGGDCSGGLFSTVLTPYL